jgi:hypothetical protein
VQPHPSGPTVAPLSSPRMHEGGVKNTYVVSVLAGREHTGNQSYIGPQSTHASDLNTGGLVTNHADSV